MATVLDVGLLNFFLPAFTLIFIVVLCYAILNKVLKGTIGTGAIWIASVCIGLISLFSGKAIDLINFVTPWFVVIFVFLLLIFMSLMFWSGNPEKGGFTELEVWRNLGGTTTVVIIGVLILVLGISQVFGPVFNPYAAGGPAEKTIGGDTIRTLFHPRVLGAVFILIIAAFSIQRISESEIKAA